MISPIDQAAIIFDESRNSLMAHTIRGAVNHFRHKGLELDVRVIADTNNMIGLLAPGRGVTSILRTRLQRAAAAGQRDCVVTSIFIHKDANRHLARICVAHELYHLLMELDAFIANNRTAWNKIPTTAAFESDCNQFAWQLCLYHDKFNRCDKQRAEFIYFPEKLFDQTLKTDKTGNQQEWPQGIALDPNNPFHKLPPATKPG
jgi:Zn-dependent peptidase ImmA (M78 family)